MTLSRLYPAMLVASLFLALAGCVTETVSGPFKQPTKDDLDKSISLYVQMAYMRLERKQYDKAMVSLNSALDIDKNSSQALTGLAVAYQYQGEKEKAEKTFHRVIRHDDKYSDAHLRYGDFLFAEQRYEEACEQYSQATEDDFYDKRSTAYFNLGACWRELGKFQAAEQAFDRCIGLQPDNYPVLIELADLKFRAKSFPEAKELFDRYAKQTREKNEMLSARALWLGIRLERIFDNQNAESSLAMMLKNNHPYSSEYLEYKKSLQAK
jgi:type IV pilus assembly protein PilF